MANVGWIRLYRKVMDTDMWMREPFTRGQAWIDLLMMAQHEEKKVLRGNRFCRIERGQVLITHRKLSERWQWSNTKVVNFVKLLEIEKMASMKASQYGTVLTIENYELYQGERAESEEENINKNVKETSGKRQENVKETLSTSYEECKELKNDNNINARAREKKQAGIPPTVEQVEAYIAEKGYAVDAEAWWDFYQSKGWFVGKNKMKDWKAAVRNWQRNNRNGPVRERPPSKADPLPDDGIDWGELTPEKLKAWEEEKNGM